MDADFVRILLLVAGVFVVVAIIFWDKVKKKQTQNQAIVLHDSDLVEDSFDEMFDADSKEDAEQFSVLDDTVDSDSPDLNDPFLADELEGLNDMMDEVDLSDVEKGEQIPLQLDVGEESAPDDFLLFEQYDDLPRQIIQIHVLSKGEPFSHMQIEEVAAIVEMEYGEMAIYHRYVETDTGRKTLFSMANLAEPGYFDPKGHTEKNIPGLLLFTQLPVAKDGLAVYSDMLFTAERIAGTLDAELQDANHSALSKQTIAHTREQILSHRRKLQLIAAGFK